VEHRAGRLAQAETPPKMMRNWLLAWNPSGFRMFYEWEYATLSTFECFGATMSYERKDPGETSGYVSYLLRLWREKDSASTWWRASLQDTLSGQRVGFAHLDELIAFLRERVDLPPPAGSLMEGESTPKMGSESEKGGSE
jgi:hypothetical protein